MNIQELDKKLVSIVPSDRQLACQELEFYGFVHFTVNTYTGKEWGDGTEEETIFNPIRFNAFQWVSAIKNSGMKGLILTCKHHDGFCLWPSKFTEHSIAKSPFRNGRGDLVKEVSDECRRQDIHFGVYLSPWDRNNEAYGTGTEYNDFFVNQLTELLSNYGEIFSVWFDGACGEEKNGKKQVYDWQRYYDLIRRLQPKACINVCGPDIRWCGNEAGDTRAAEWSVVPKRTSETEKIAADSQKVDDTAFRERKIRASDQDLGSREMLKDETELIWYPAEVNTSIRPGWFYHEEEDSQVRSLEELLHIYYNSVGGNATFLLNIPPTKEGLFHQNDVKRLQEIGDYIHQTFQYNLLEEAELKSDSFEDGHEIEKVREDNYEHYFKTVDGTRDALITISFQKSVSFTHIVLKENIKRSQRIEKYQITDKNGKLLNEGSTVGHKKIIKFSPIQTSQINIHILDARVCPTLSFIGVY